MRTLIQNIKCHFPIQYSCHVTMYYQKQAISLNEPGPNPTKIESK